MRFPRLADFLGAVWLGLGLGALAGEAEGGESDWDGIYAESGTFINEQGEESHGVLADYAVLELQGDRFKYWHFSDAVGFRAYPIKGRFSRQGELMELESDELMPTERDWVATTVKGVEGIWPKKGLQEWREGKLPLSVPVLVKVAEGPTGKEGLDKAAFKFPSVTPLLNREAAKQFWTEQNRKYVERYKDVPEPLRTLMRERSCRDDGGMQGYRNAVLILQERMDPLLVKQLVAETGEGVSVVVGPMVLEDIYGPSHLLPDRPAFEKTLAHRRAALLALVDAMGEAKNRQALTATLLVFLRASGLESVELEIGQGSPLRLSWVAKRKTYVSYTFSDEVRARCCAWARSKVEEKFALP